MKHILLLAVFIFLIGSCRDNPQSGPVDIYYGEDICERCNMIISERDFAAQYKLPGGDTLKFDDLGCMFHYMSKDNDSISEIYVVDYNSQMWIDGQEAYYVWTESIATPMGYGILAVEESQEAKVLTKKERGKYLGDLKAASTWIMKNNITDQD